MDRIFSQVKDLMDDGSPEDEAVSTGRRLIREAIQA
jgi:hypothetical protein